MVIVDPNIYLGHTGYRFTQWMRNGKPTLINEFVYYVTECKRINVPATRKGFLEKLGKPTKHGHLAGFFTAVRRSGLFEITKGENNENLYNI